MGDIERFPNIEKAALEIAYDNGGINRDRSEAQQKRDLRSFLLECGLEREHLRDIDTWLGTLSKNDLQTVCAGEYNESQTILANAPMFTDHLLNEIFDGNGVC